MEENQNQTTQPSSTQLIGEDQSLNQNADQVSQTDVKQAAVSTGDTSTGVTGQLTPEMATALEGINDDLGQNGLTQEEIQKKKNQQKEASRIQNFRKKTLGDNASRLAGNGLTRAAMLGAVVVALVGGVAVYTLNSDDQVEADLAGSVDLPNANVSGNATLTPEQAELERRNQQEQATNALENGETYIPSVIIERDADKQYLVGDGIVPGVRVELDEQGRPITNNLASAGLDPSLAHNGGSTNSASDGSRAPTNNFQNGNGGYDNNQQQTQQTQQTQTFTPTIPQNKYASNIEALDQSGRNVDDWQNGIANHWLQKAAQTEEAAQVAFMEQLNSLLSTKPKSDNGNASQNRYAQYSYAQKKDASNNIGSANSATGTSYAGETKRAANSSYTDDGLTDQKKVYIRAGTSYTTQLISEVNTDEGTEVLARIASGPYKDAQLIGSVRQANKNIQFVFTRLIPKKGPELSIEAVAREIGTNKMGMADDIQTHTFKRYTGMILASGMQGYGEAWSDVGTTVSNGYGGTTQTKTKPNDQEIGGRIVGQIGQSVSQDIMKNTNIPTTYITYSGKVFNLYFNNDVTKANNN